MDIQAMLRDTGALQSMAGELGIDPVTAADGAQALLPGLVGGLQQQGTAQGFGGLGSMIEAMGGGNLLDLVTASAPTPAQPGNDIVGAVLGGGAASSVIEQAAARSGLDKGLLQRMLPMLAMAVAGYLARQGSGGAAAGGGGLGGILGQVLGGAAGAQPQPQPQPAPAQGGLGGLAGMLDRDGDGNAMDDIADLAGGFFKK